MTEAEHVSETWDLNPAVMHLRVHATL